MSSGGCLAKSIAQRTGKEAEYLTPDMVAVINPFQEKVRLQVNPLFVAGRYRKLVRTIPQSKWFCSNCQGRGCEECGGTGKLYPESVEELSSGQSLTQLAVKNLLSMLLDEKTSMQECWAQADPL